MPRASHVWRLGVKEVWALLRDPIMIFLIGYVFTISVYVAATAVPDSLHAAAVAIVDEDGSPLSARIAAAFQPPHFRRAEQIALSEMDAALDEGAYTFVLDVPPAFQRDVLAGRAPAVQLNVDATRTSQALTGSGYVQRIVLAEVDEFVRGHREAAVGPVEIAIRARFNPSLTLSWFGGLNEVMDAVTMLSIVLAGAALIREREHGTVEHLLVMPVTSVEIMLAKIWSTALIVLAAAWCSLTFVVRGTLHVPVEGSVLLFLALSALHLLATTSMGLLMATMARTMPQFGMAFLLTVMPLQVLSGGLTPRESMPDAVQLIMNVAPTTHFVAGSQAILFRGAGLDVIWPRLLALVAIGAGCFALALWRFPASLRQRG